MPALDSDKLDEALRVKMRATVQDKRRHRIYLIADANGQFLASTAVSRGGKFTTSATLVSKMAHDLCLTVDQLVGVVRCPLSRDDALTAIVRNQQDALP